MSASCGSYCPPGRHKTPLSMCRHASSVFLAHRIASPTRTPRLGGISAKRGVVRLAISRASSILVISPGTNSHIIYRLREGFIDYGKGICFELGIGPFLCKGSSQVEDGELALPVLRAYVRQPLRPKAHQAKAALNRYILGILLVRVLVRCFAEPP